MKYIAITQQMAEWLLGKRNVIEHLYKTIEELGPSGGALRESDFVFNSIRVSYSVSGELLAIWNLDYISGTGSENWGLIRWKGELSIEESSEIGVEVFERCLYVSSQRLQGLMLDGSFIHRAYDNGAHTIISGRGSIAHKLSLSYYEQSVGGSGIESRSIIIVGPGQSFAKLKNEAARAGRQLTQLTAQANSLVNPRAFSKTVLSQNEFDDLRASLSPYFEHQASVGLFSNVELHVDRTGDHARYAALSFDQWIQADSPLSEAKRRILAADSIDAHPLRILGPAGSGKTLLMQLLAVKKIQSRKTSLDGYRILYLAHSRAMQGRTHEKFGLLLGEPLAPDGKIGPSQLIVTTLADYCVNQLGLSVASVLDTDADGAKRFQLEQVLTALKAVNEKSKSRVSKSTILKQVFGNTKLLQLFAALVLVEISAAIKGHGLEADKRRYVESERSLSLLHANLNQDERTFVYEVFTEYHSVVFEHFQTLDPDDIAISLAARLRTPVWQLKRQIDGFDYVFVDEAQLFNENERRLFALLTRSEVPHVPIALALDQSQATYGQSSAGLSTIGIKDATSETLMAVHRSTESIVRLAFFIIQRSTSLFGPDFPDFTRSTTAVVPDTHQQAAPPEIVWQTNEGSIGEFVVTQVEALRRANTRQIVVICYYEAYWSSLQSSLSAGFLPYQIITERGVKIPDDKPVVALAKPAHVGGQEFDAAILIGLEFGVMPPTKIENPALANAIEQQVIRDVYLGITRARYRVIFAMTKDSSPNRLIEMARTADLVRIPLDSYVPKQSVAPNVQRKRDPK